MRLACSASFFLVAAAVSLTIACGSSSDPPATASETPEAGTLDPDGGSTPASDASLSNDAPTTAACAFTTFDTHVSLTLTAVWGASEDDVWVGTTGTSLVNDSRLLRFDGKAFGAPIDSTSFDDILDIEGTAADDVWIAGTLSDSSHRTLLHWDGASLVPAVVPAPTSLKSTFRAVWPRTRGDVWVVGESSVLHFDGASWAKPATYTVSMFDTFYGTAVAGSSDKEVLFASMGTSGLRWDGAQFASAPTPGLRALKRGAKGPYWGIDPNARALKSSTDGVTWTSVRTFTKDEPNPVSLAVDADGNPWIGTNRVAVPNGYDGPFVEHLENGVWQKSTPAKLDVVRALAVAGRSVWAVGSFGQAARCMRP
ncbi:MAG TPA: hypothetical protein VLT33_00135 [Labilithrix sp.]|nr:hypothetical protein [Labilithrix sp.]